MGLLLSAHSGQAPYAAPSCEAGTGVHRQFSFSRRLVHRRLHSFPTRRSSDLILVKWAVRGVGRPSASCALSRTLPSETRDRKSTRLNSSHSQISYAGSFSKKQNWRDALSLDFWSARVIRRTGIDGPAGESARG